METGSHYLSGSFRDRKAAERVYNKLREKGYTDKEIDILMSDDTRSRFYDKDRKYTENESDLGSRTEKTMQGAGTGSAIGGAIGATAGIIAALGTSLIIPGLGFVVAGPIAAGLAGAGAGGITGGIVGALIGLGIPEDRAKNYERRLKDGNIIMGVKPRTDEDATYLEDDWRNNEGEDIYR